METPFNSVSYLNFYQNFCVVQLKGEALGHIAPPSPSWQPCSHLLSEFRLQQLGLIDGFFHSCFISVICYITTAAIEYMREYLERFIESNTDNFWMEYLTNTLCLYKAQVVAG